MNHNHHPISSSITYDPTMRARPALWMWLVTTVILTAGLSACGGSTGLENQEAIHSPPPDWVRFESGEPRPAQVGLKPDERTQQPFAVFPEGIHWRYWRYASPGIKQLSLPRDQPMDMALVAIDARVTALQHKALCRPNDCEPLKPEFPAIAMLIGRPGSLEAAGIQVGSRIEYGQPSKDQPAQVNPLQ